MKVFGAPIEGVNDWMTELALVFAKEAESEAEALSEICRLDAESTKLSEQMESAQSEMARLEPQLAEAQSDLEEAAAKYGRFGMDGLGKPIVGGCVFCLLAGGLIHPIVSTLGILGLMGWGVAFFLEKKNRTQALSPLEDDLEELSGKVNTLKTAISGASARIEEIATEKQVLQPSKTVEAVGRVYYPVESRNVAGYPVLIDGAGVEGAVDLLVPDLISDPAAIKKIKSTVSAASGKPMLLQARDTCGHEIDSLQGEESDLREAVESFSDMVDSIPQVAAKLRLIPAQSGLVKEFAAHVDDIHEESVPGLTLSDPNAEDTQKSIEQLTAVAERMRGAGKDADRVLRETYDSLQGLLDDYRELRADALEGLHRNVLDVVQLSHMTQVTHYCPRCNRLPEYMFQKLGLPLEEAHTQDQRAIFSQLMSDSEIAERLSKDEEILREMDGAHRGLIELEHNIARIHTQMEGDTAAVGAASTMAANQQGRSRLNALQAQHGVLVKTYQRWLRKAVTGSDRPMLEIATQARLFLDPHHGTWTCAACQTCFDEPVYIQMGQMLKYQEHLMMPMWNHLWTEKDDLRKQEIFRTNEALQRMSEKESEKLVNIGDQYRSDMRPVRENLIRASGETETKTAQLFDTIEGLADIGLLTAADGDKARSEIQSRLGSDLIDSKRRAENKELLLTQEPQAQVRRRASAIDPASFFMTPESLFRQVPRGARLSIPRQAEVEAIEQDEVTDG